MIVHCVATVDDTPKAFRSIAKTRDVQSMSGFPCNYVTVYSLELESNPMLFINFIY
jgi:hypothetical protein